MKLSIKEVTSIIMAYNKTRDINDATNCVNNLHLSDTKFTQVDIMKVINKFVEYYKNNVIDSSIEFHLKNEKGITEYLDKYRGCEKNDLIQHVVRQIYDEVFQNKAA